MISLRHVFADRIGLTLQTPEPRKPSQTEKVLVNHIIMTHHFHLKALVYLAVGTVHLTLTALRSLQPSFILILDT